MTNIRRMVGVSRCVCVACVVVLVGCSGQGELDVELGERFVRIDKPDRGAKADLPTDVAEQTVSERDFYLAIRKDQLGKGRRWFLSAYMKTLRDESLGEDDFAFPGANSLGTRVVSFEAQNGHLMVFDVADIYQASDTFDPEIVLDAFPLVGGYEPFEDLEGSEDYFLFDPSLGDNEFAVLGHDNGVPFDFDKSLRPIATQVTFLQNFRPIHDGITFEKVFAGTVVDTENAIGHVYGTLGLAIREYRESDNFQESLMPETEHYFGSIPRRIPNQKEGDRPVGKWHIYEGMEPIEWVISDVVNKVAQDPKLAGVDVEGAMRRGVENWNDVFGFEVLTTRLATTNDSYANDDVNYLVIDQDPSFPGAFADWRLNPNTGEIRGASIYFNSYLFDIAADIIFPAGDGGAPPPPPAYGLAQNSARLHWGPMPGGVLCSYRPRLTASEPQPGEVGAIEIEMTREEKIEKFVTHVVVHEVGHTLGLRHNFKGSMTQPASSAMDYLDDATDSLDLHQPGAYDIDAIRWLYLGQEELPPQPFCEDGGYLGSYESEERADDPDCTPFDKGVDPLVDYHKVQYDAQKDLLLLGVLPLEMWEDGAGAFFNIFLDRYIWSGDRAQEAFEMVMEGVAAPIDPSLLANPAYGPAADVIARVALATLFEAPYGLADIFPALVLKKDDAALNAAITEQLSGILLNEDGIRSFQSRLEMIRHLKTHQSEEALAALYAALPELEVELTVSPGNAAQVSELIEQVKAALEPYYE